MKSPQAESLTCRQDSSSNLLDQLVPGIEDPCPRGHQETVDGEAQELGTQESWNLLTFSPSCSLALTSGLYWEALDLEVSDGNLGFQVGIH